MYSIAQALRILFWIVRAWGCYRQVLCRHNHGTEMKYSRGNYETFSESDTRTGFAVFIAAASFCWFYLYSGDIPNFAALGSFAPATPTTAADECSSTTISVVPYSHLGQNLQNSTRAAEGNDRILAMQIARGMFCQYRGKTLERDLLECKASVQLQRRFTSDQLLAVFLNRAFFGDTLVGAESACRQYYGRSCSELDVGQAAMIARLLKSPHMYSPELHPDRARARRDAVIALMIKKGAITPAQGQAAMKTDVK